jgi:hypothetical protein
VDFGSATRGWRPPTPQKSASGSQDLRILWSAIIITPPRQTNRAQQQAGAAACTRAGIAPYEYELGRTAVPPRPRARAPPPPAARCACDAATGQYFSTYEDLAGGASSRCAESERCARGWRTAAALAQADNIRQ